MQSLHKLYKYDETSQLTKKLWESFDLQISSFNVINIRPVNQLQETLNLLVICLGEIGQTIKSEITILSENHPYLRADTLGSAGFIPMDTNESIIVIVGTHLELQESLNPSYFSLWLQRHRNSHLLSLFDVKNDVLTDLIAPTIPTFLVPVENDRDQESSEPLLARSLIEFCNARFHPHIHTDHESMGLLDQEGDNPGLFIAKLFEGGTSPFDISSHYADAIHVANNQGLIQFPLSNCLVNIAMPEFDPLAWIKIEQAFRRDLSQEHIICHIGSSRGGMPGMVFVSMLVNGKPVEYELDVPIDPVEPLDY